MINPINILQFKANSLNSGSDFRCRNFSMVFIHFLVYGFLRKRDTRINRYWLIHNRAKGQISTVKGLNPEVTVDCVV